MQRSDDEERGNPVAVRLLYLCVFGGFMADMLLVPYYPQFFQRVYGVENPQYVGALIALCRLIMMFAYPMWAKLSKRFSTLNVLVFTQLLAGLTCLACVIAPNEWVFLAFAMASAGFKSSYLLIYPLLVRWAGTTKQTQAVSRYGLLTHSAAVTAAVVGGSFLEITDPRALLLLMAAIDWLQMGISWWLSKRVTDQTSAPETADANANANAELIGRSFTFSIIWLVFLYYAAVSLIRPYFTRYIESLSLGLSGTETGVLFVLPAAMCIVISLCYKRFRLDQNSPLVVVVAATVVSVTTWMQVAGESVWQIAFGRMAYGAALFMVQASIDLILFRNSKSEDIAWNYRLVTFAMNAALIVAPLSLGSIIQYGGLDSPFYVSLAISVIFTISSLLIFYPKLIGLNPAIYGTLRSLARVRSKPQSTHTSTGSRL